ncbi:hypothetical protein C7Y68_12490 [Paracidovorax avenae]|uniref:YdcF family protein n=1 Tax=Paracidovorax avenae TaxID=80867 RepID=UPI000D17B385|nr:YdcF family protein [Paracidovorax avenae]AVS99298.1 hypothetical protein C8236_11010 [Paracidovorax avenae]AVT20706.1 hypothetical protein C7Y68_12490 [Paracidovorax avenae]
MRTATSAAAGPGWRLPGARLLLALAGAVLLADGLWLMALRQFNLGVALPAVCGAVLLVLALRWEQAARWRRAHRGRMLAWRMAWCAVGLWMLSVAWFWVWLRDYGVPPAEVPPVQAIVVLGAGTLDGQPRPTLAARLDTAAELARRQPQALVAVCGGIDLGETESEAAIMARYLHERHGIAPGRIVQERESTSTELNIALSRPLLQARGVAAVAPTAIVTSDFHLMRATRIARRQGLAGVVPVGAPTPITTRYNAWLREYFAMLSSWALREI